MAENAGAQGADIVGRAKELGILRAFLAGAETGTAGTLVVAGDAGVGKTALVQHASTSPAFAGWTLSGTCLPLATVSIPFLPLLSALRSAPALDGGILPALQLEGGLPRDMLPTIDGWLDGLCAHRPVLLVIDDLQWADQSTLDVLMYLVAGPGNRRLAVVATQRTGELGEDHPLQRWLADIRRMPRTHWLELGPLDRPDTETHVAHLLGAPPHQSLLEEVYGHTGGNAYLNRLVVAGLDADARHLPPRLPPDLKGAVLRSWRSLSGSARRLTQLMAVGGRPLSCPDLAAVSRQDGTHDGVLPLLQEAAAAGILECSAAGALWWFHHPLIAEVLVQGLDGDARRHWHALFAAHGEAQAAASEKVHPSDAARLRPETSGAAEFESMAALADHHFHSGHASHAYRWALRGAAAAGQTGGGAETLRLLRRALALHAELPDAPESRLELLNRLRNAAEKAGAADIELEAIEGMLAGTDRTEHPLDVAELLVRRMLLRMSTGREFLSPDAVEEAVKLSRAYPGSWQHAYALAEQAHAALWMDDPAAPELAARALEQARAAGNPRALSFALTANSMAALFAGQEDTALKLACAAGDAAAQARDFWAMVHAIMWQANATEAWTGQAFAELMRSARERLSGLGAPHAYLAQLAADEASSFLAVGRWRECLAALRIALGSDPGGMGDVGARLTAARLAAWQGRQSEAEAHLARGEELFPPSSTFTNLCFDAVRAEVLLAAGMPAKAYAAALTGLDAQGQPPTMCEWLVPLAARALADLLQGARDDGGPTVDLLGDVQRLQLRFPAALRESGNDTPQHLAQVIAFDALYRAELGRALASSANAAQWTDSADACAAAALGWEEAYSWWRAAESLLLHGHAGRQQAVPALRRGLLLATELQAAPLLEQLNALATGARITALPGTAGAESGAGRVRLPGLTPREREVLELVIAGLSYAEIAAKLVLSEKTVSTHISNLLRKSGAANRVDLARLAMRPAANRR